MQSTSLPPSAPSTCERDLPLLPFIPLPPSSSPPPSTSPPRRPAGVRPPLSYNDRLTPLLDKGLCGDEERFDPPSVLRSKSRRLAALLRASSHTVVFTGAGISTASGIPDFRGPQGLWTKEGEREGRREGEDDEDADSAEEGGEGSGGSSSNVFSGAVPSFTHRALASLHRRGFVQCVVTQNVDNLHVRSGLPRSGIVELHGNIFVAHCRPCRTHFYHEEDVGGMGCRPLPCPPYGCPRCGLPCVDDAVDWTTPLPQRQFDAATQHIRRASLCVVLGSSLRVAPASSLPSQVRWKRPGRGVGQLVVVNLQATHVDDKCAVRLWGKVDDVLAAVCDDLHVPVPHWTPQPMQPYTYEVGEEDGAGREDGEEEDEEYVEGAKGSRRGKRRRGGASGRPRQGQLESSTAD